MTSPADDQGAVHLRRDGAVAHLIFDRPHARNAMTWTMYEGMADRLKQELVNRAPSGAEIRVVAAADRKYAVWKGGSTLASLSTFASSWVTKEDYEEHGAAVIHRKCN